MNPEARIDARADVVAYLDRRKCGQCRSSLSSVAIDDVARTPLTCVYRCFPPVPTWWTLRCPGCGQDLVIAARKGKCWRTRGEITRRSPRPRPAQDP